VLDPARDDVELPFLDPALNGPLVAYLCSDEADWITGQAISVNGGYFMG